jgi:glycosyltransferase involved in cell wall biosynthesis
VSQVGPLPEVLFDLRMVNDQITGVGRYLLRTFAQLQELAAQELRVTGLVRHGQTVPVDGPTRSLAGRAGALAPLMAQQWWTLPRALRHDRCALVHYTYFDLPPLPRRTPIVATCYDLEPLRHPQLFSAKIVWYYRLFSRGLRRADRIVTISQASARDIVEITGIPRDRLVVAPLGVDAHFQPAPPDAIAAVRRAHALPELFVAYVGNTMPHKNLERVVHAMRQVRAACGPVPLVIAGAPDRYRPQVLAAAAAAGLGDGLRLLGRIDEAELPALVSAARVFVFPSLYEGFGLPVLEAMACGTPVVTSTRASLPEVAGDAASLCDPLDVDAIGHAIVRLLRDDAAHARQRAAGLARAETFTWARCAAAHRLLYLDLLGS